MKANTSLERRVAQHYAGEPPLRAPDRVLHSALATIETTRQRRGVLAPWRYPNMSMFAKVAAAFVVAIAIGGIAVWQLGTPGTGGTQTPAPTATSVPTTRPTAAVPTAPPVTETFQSDIHGITIGVPAGWDSEAATKPWASGVDLPWTFTNSSADFIYDPARTANLFLGLASQPLGDEPASEWIDRMLAMADPEPCRQTEPVEVGGAQGRLATCDEPLRAFVTDGERGYAVFLYRSGDDSWVEDVYGPEFFNGLLQTVQLRPGDAAAAARTSG